ncbi:MAG: hypothetical protein JWO20_3066 [Candidatus Angelobacter sp.]|jgi:hypothetical protein|nr:hypothetical protein [Candidatus Angelobacter sp.]
MKKIFSIMLLVFLTSGIQAYADSFSQQLDALGKKVGQKILTSKLNPSVKGDFNQQLATILADAGCHQVSGKGPDACASATPSAIQQAEGKLNKLSDAVDQAIKDDGAKSMSLIYLPKITELRRQITAAKVDVADKQKLERRLGDFEASLGGKTGRPVSPEDADKTLKGIADDLATAIDLNQKSGTLADGFMAKADALRKKIEGAKLNQQFKSDFLKQLNAIVGQVCPAGGSGPATAGVKGACGRATPSAIQKGESDLAKLEADVDKAVQEDGGKDMSQIYRPQIDALTAKLDKSKVDPSDRQRLLERMRNFLVLAGGKGGVGPGSRTGAPITPEELQKQFQQLSNDVDAAILLAENSKSKTFADDFIRKAGDLKKKIDGSRLNPAVARDFNGQLSNIISQAGCGATASSGKMNPCSNATPSIISKAESDLAKLSDDVDKAIKADTGKSMYEIYKSRLDALKEKIGRSKIDPADKQKLDRRLEELTSSVRAMGGPGGGIGKGGSALRTPEDVDRAIKQLSDDIDAAISMSATKR